MYNKNRAIYPPPPTPPSPLNLDVGPLKSLYFHVFSYQNHELHRGLSRVLDHPPIQNTRYRTRWEQKLTQRSLPCNIYSSEIWFESYDGIAPHLIEKVHIKKMVVEPLRSASPPLWPYWFKTIFFTICFIII